MRRKNATLICKFYSSVTILESLAFALLKNLNFIPHLSLPHPVRDHAGQLWRRLCREEHDGRHLRRRTPRLWTEKTGRSSSPVIFLYNCLTCTNLNWHYKGVQMCTCLAFEQYLSSGCHVSGLKKPRSPLKKAICYFISWRDLISGLIPALYFSVLIPTHFRQELKKLNSKFQSTSTLHFPLSLFIPIW